MNTATDSIAAMAKAQVDAALQIATAGAAGAERIADLQIKALKSGFDKSLSQLEALAAVKEPAELQGLAARFSQPAMDEMGAYARDITAAVQATRTEVTRIVETQVSELGARTSAAIEAALKNSPAGSEAATSAVKQMVSYGQAACETAMKSLNGMVQAAEAQFAGVAPAPAGRKKAS
jgi:phasin family protein